MKTAFFSLITFLAAQSFAIDITSSDVADLPQLKGAAVSVKLPHPMTAVQPTAHVTFKYNSCAVRQFEGQIAKENGVYFIKIEDKKKWDCRARGVDRDYSVQISSDFRLGSQVVLLNPLHSFSSEQ